MKHQWIYSGKVLIKALFFEYISFLFSLFLFFFQQMIWRLNLASQYYRPLSSGSQKKGIYSKHFTAESLCHCHLLIYHIYQNNWITCSRYLTILWPNSGSERLFFPFQKLKRRSAAEFIYFLYRSILLLVIPVFNARLQSQLLFISCYSRRNFPPLKSYARTISFVLEHVCRAFLLFILWSIIWSNFFVIPALHWYPYRNMSTEN